MRAVVKGNPDAGFGARIKQTLASWIFPDRVDVGVVRQPADEFGPGFAEVAGLENVGMKVVQLVGVHGNVSSRGVKGRCVDQADHGPFGHLFRRNVRPVLSSVARDMKKAIVGSSPQHAILLGRFGQAEYDVVILDGVLIFRDEATGILLLGLIIASEVRTDGGPGTTLIGGTENEL